MTRYLDLGENDDIAVTYETCTMPMQEKQIVVSLLINNKTQQTMKDIEFMVLDTLNTRYLNKFTLPSLIHFPFKQFNM